MPFYRSLFFLLLKSLVLSVASSTACSIHSPFLVFRRLIPLSLCLSPSSRTLCSPLPRFQGEIRDMQPISHPTDSSTRMDNAIRTYCGSKTLPSSQLTPEKIAGLEAIFRDCPKPSLLTHLTLCNELGISLHSVLKWFRDRREGVENEKSRQVQAERDHGSWSYEKNQKRRNHTPEQIARLEEVYKDWMYPTANLRLRLSQQLGMSPEQVAYWFDNRRRRIKNHIGDNGQSSSTEDPSSSYPVSVHHAHLKEILEQNVPQNHGYETKIKEKELKNLKLIEENKRLRKENNALKASKIHYKCSSCCPKPHPPYSAEAAHLHVENTFPTEKEKRAIISLDTDEIFPVMWLSPNSAEQSTSHRDN